MAKKIDLSGKKIGRITILRKLGIINGLVYWEYECDCGVVKKGSTSTLNAKRIKSCGCLRNEIIGAQNRKEFGKSASNRLITNYKNSAKRRLYCWKLTDEEFFILTKGNCHYCGTLPINNTKKISPNSFGHIEFNGVDRIDNNIGYTIENCVTCCRNCNMAKCNFSYEEFMAWLKRIIEFRNKNESKTSLHI